MNNKNKNNFFAGVKILKPHKEKNISAKKHIGNTININTYKNNKKNLYKTSSNKNKSINKNSYNKSQTRKQTLSSINNGKSLKIFEVKKKKNNKIKFSLNFNDESSFSRIKYKSDKNFYNTINAINTRVKIFNKNDFIIKDFNKKNRSIQNSSRVKINHIRYNTYSNNYNGSREELSYKIKNSKKEDKMKQSNNIIINFFNAPINKYNEEFYFNNINDINKIIIKNKQIKKKVFNIFNHVNRKTPHNNDNLNNNIKNIYPLFSSNNNNYNNFEFQIYQNKKRTISNIFDNLKTIVNSHSITKVKKSPNYKESIDIYSNRYKKIKFNKNKKATKNLSLNIKLKGENKLKTIFKKTKNYYNFNTINKNNLLNSKKEHYIRSKNLKTEHKIKNKHILYNLLFKSTLKTEKNKSNKTKTKNLKDILSFNRLNIFKSIDVERSFKNINKFNTIITEVQNNNKTKKTIKNKFLKKSSIPIQINNNIHYHQKKNNDNNMKTIFNHSNHNNNAIKENKIIKLNQKLNEQNNKNKKNNSENQLIINKDPKYLGEYLDEILCNLYLEEKKYMEKIGFQISSDILNTYGINPETRTCLIDSLIDLQKIFDFNERTLFITVQIFDRYIALSIIKEINPRLKEENLDIILTSSLLIASKLEESILYKLSDYLGILSEKYTLEDIKITENKIMNLLDFSAISPTFLDFFEIFAEKINLNDAQKNKGLFLLNTILLDINLSQISGSVIAYAVIIILIQENNNSNNDYNFKDLIEVLNLMNKNMNRNKLENTESLSLMNNEEKMEELCHLIQVFAEGILKTEYNHISEKFNCNKNDYITKLNKFSSI